jgi:hypothetical protein
MQDLTPALTERQRHWLEHIQACKQSGKTIAEYAAEHGFTARAMYAGKKCSADLLDSATTDQ